MTDIITLDMDTNALLDLMVIVSNARPMREAMREFLQDFKTLFKSNCKKELEFVIGSTWGQDKPGRTWNTYKADISNWIETGAIRVENVNRHNNSKWERCNQVYRSSMYITTKNTDTYDIDLIFLALEKNHWVVTSDSGICRVLINEKKPFLTPYSLLKFYYEFSSDARKEAYWHQFHTSQASFRSTAPRSRDLVDIRHEENKNYIRFIDTHQGRRRIISIRRSTINYSDDDFFEPIRNITFNPLLHLQCQYYGTNSDQENEKDCLSCRYFGNNCLKILEGAT